MPFPVAPIVGAQHSLSNGQTYEFNAQGGWDIVTGAENSQGLPVWPNVLTVADNGSALAHGYRYRFDTSGGAFTVFLQDISDVTDSFIFQDIAGTTSVNNLTVSSHASDTIEGALTYVLSTDNVNANLYADSTTNRWTLDEEAGGASTPEVIESAGALTGAAPAGAKFGVDITNDVLYTVEAGNWAEYVEGKNRVHADNASIVPATSGQPTVAEIQTFATGNTLTDVVVYYTGDNNAANPASYTYIVDKTGTVSPAFAPGSAVPTPWTVVNAAGALAPGDYILDSSGAAFAVTLSEVVGEWEFSDPSMSTGANNVTVGTAAQTFTDNSGAQVAGPLVANVDGAHFKIVNTDGSANFYLVFFTTGGGSSSVGSIDDLTDVDTTTVAPAIGQILQWDGTNFVPQTNSASSSWVQINSAQALAPGKYSTDSSGGAFAVTLTEVIGEWEISDPLYQSTTNNVTIGTGAQNFTDETGASVAGPLTLDSNGAWFKIINLDGSANFQIVQNPDAVSTVGIVPRLLYKTNNWGGGATTILNSTDIFDLNLLPAGSPSSVYDPFSLVNAGGAFVVPADGDYMLEIGGCVGGTNNTGAIFWGLNIATSSNNWIMGARINGVNDSPNGYGSSVQTGLSAGDVLHVSTQAPETLSNFNAAVWRLI